MTRALLALLIYASLASAQPWQWQLTNPNWKNPTNFPQLSPDETPICVGDVTGDGFAEVMQFGVQDYLSVRDAEGTWTEILTNGGPVMVVNEHFTVCNLDSDPALELVVSSDVTEPAINCYKLDTDTSVWTWDLRLDLIQGRLPSLITSLHSITWGNFDQDEYEEAAVLQQTIYFEDALFIYQRTADGEPWTSQNEYVFQGMSPRNLYSGDFDHDGDFDIAVEVDGIDGYEGTMIFENSVNGIQVHDPDTELLGPGGGDLDGDGEWEFLYVNTCIVPPHISVDGPFVHETTGLHEYSLGKDLRDISTVIGLLRESSVSYVAGVTSFFCFSPWGGPNTTRTDILTLSSADYHAIWSISGNEYLDFARGDVNADGRDDFLCLYHGYNGVGYFEPRWAVLMNVGNEVTDEFESVPGLHFYPNGVYFPDEFRSPRLGDIDGDSQAELILSPTNEDEIGMIQIFRIEQLTPEEILPRAQELEIGLPDSISSYDVTDLDGDGLTEILLVENGHRAAYFFRNGQWDRYDNVLPNITGYIRGFADWDNNGTMDIFTEEGIYLSMSPSAADDPITAPLSFTLSSYPNPFNAQTNITFELPRAGEVTLKLFDVLGREIETLLNEPLAAGTHTHSFDAAQLPSGVYFAQLESGGLLITHKLLLLK